MQYNQKKLSLKIRHFIREEEKKKLEKLEPGGNINKNPLSLSYSSIEKFRNSPIK